MECMGLRAASPKLEVKEGFIRLSFDMIVKEANAGCLFKN